MRSATSTKRLLGAIQSLGGNANAISREFHRIGIALEEVAEGKRRHPAVVDAIHQVFPLAVPTEGMAGARDEVYRAHVHELVERAAAWGSDPESVNFYQWRDGTLAEVFSALMETSLAGPLGSIAAAVLERAFVRILPEVAWETLRIREPSKRLEADCDELEATMRRRLAVAARYLQLEPAPAEPRPTAVVDLQPLAINVTGGRLSRAQAEAVELGATPYRQTAEALVRKGVWARYREGWDADEMPEYTPESA
jgi:hypothetical protein